MEKYTIPNLVQIKSGILSSLTICIASSWYPHADNPYHCIFVHEFAKRIKRAGIKAFVVTLNYSRKDEKFGLLDGVPVIRLNPKSSDVAFQILRCPNLAMAFRKADIVHVHAIDSFGSTSILLAKLLRKPVVVTVHRDDVLPTNLISNLLRTIALKIVDVVIAVSDATRSLALTCGARSGKVITVYNVVDESIFIPRSKTACRSKLAIPQNYKVILSVGNLIRRKGFHCLLVALPSILSRIANTIAIFVGDGPQRDELVRLVKNLKLENKVFFTGRIATDKLCLYYGAADVYILPSFHEGHAMVLLEAMASGLPVVATKVGGNVETVIHEENGYLVQPKNVKQLAEAIMKILSDENLMRRFSSQSLKIYRETFSEEQQVRKIAQIYSRIAGKKV